MEQYPDQLFVHPERPNSSKMNDVADQPHMKPYGGLWTSSYRDGTCGWIEWMQSEQWAMHDEMDVWLLTVTDPDLYVIDSMADAKRLVEEYPRDPDDLDWKMTPDTLSTPSYEAAAVDYDGIWLTTNGQSVTRLPGPSEPELYGWDCECTIWFDWVFDSVERLGTVTLDEGITISESTEESE